MEPLEERMKKMDEEFSNGIGEELKRRQARGFTGMDLVEKETFAFKVWSFKFKKKWKRELKEVARRKREEEKDHV